MERLTFEDMTRPSVEANSSSKFLVNRSLTLLISFVIINILLIIDTSIVRISTFTGGMYPLESYMILFVIIYAAYATGNVIIIRLVTSQLHSTSANKSLLFKSFFAGITATQYVILLMIFILICQIITNKSYSVWILKSISYNSYLMGGIILFVLSYKLFSWYRKNKKIILILYFFAMALICANSLLMMSTLEIQLATKPDKISYTRTLAGGFAPGSGVFKLIQEYIIDHIICSNMACHGTLDEKLFHHNWFHKILGNYANIVNLFYRAISAYVFWHCKSIYHKHNIGRYWIYDLR